LSKLVKALFVCFALAPGVCAQNNTRVDQNKYALIVNGAGGEPAYAKQFEEWTTQLRSALSDHYGFGTQQTTVLPHAKAGRLRDWGCGGAHGSAPVWPSPIAVARWGPAPVVSCS